MDKHIFKFKQFEVDQTGCAMKVNTDGVLLAALAECENCESILDIGTGTGVIALMLAQRFSQANIHAIEIESAASATARKNFEKSVFTERLSVDNVSIENFTTTQRFDLIISNPPYFINDLRNSEVKKGIARHANDQFFTQLLAKVDEFLSLKGCFWFILPIKQAELLIANGNRRGLSVSKQILLHSDKTKSPFRCLVCLNRFKTEADIEHFYIYEAEKVYTKQYKELLKDFFLGY
ncbi:methyltransferase [Pedobacter sp. Du54]|uniref:tRNA1(Val) (adenine(37)-N6)-methyltransferase n=1 Tax=Pedobacter anseongensis TaxID=3133439 RepID=UPI00309ECB94